MIMGKKEKPVKGKAAPAPKPTAPAGAPEFIAKAPIRRLMKSYGANLVAEDALLGLISYLENYGMDVTKKALEIAAKDKRKKASAEDIAAAVKAL